jgi:hypothetical protein
MWCEHVEIVYLRHITLIVLGAKIGYYTLLVFLGNYKRHYQHCNQTLCIPTK